MIAIFLITLVILIVCLLVKFTSKDQKGLVKEKQASLNQNLMKAAQNIGKNTYGNYWQSFKVRKPTEAREIQLLCKRDMSKISDKDCFEIVTTILRWSQNAGVPVGNLKDWFLTNFEKEASGITYNQAIEMLKKEKIKESKQFYISPDNTACNFMLEFLIEKRSKEEARSLNKEVAERLNIPDEGIDDFIDKIENKEQELNIAPDISQLDREENRLFHLAEEGVKMFNNLPIGIDKHLTLSDEGRAEALILCSTLVLKLHSSFKNEIDLDVETDRYFLLLHDATLVFDTEDSISFLNNRIDFYNKQVKEAIQLNPLQLFNIENPIGYLFNILYLHPGNNRPLTLRKTEISVNDLVMFRGQLKRVVEYMNSGRLKITGQTPSDQSEYYDKAIALLRSLIPPSKKPIMNSDIAWVLSDQFISMIKNGVLSPDLPLPSNIKEDFHNLVLLGKRLQLSNSDISKILNDVQNEFVNSF